MKDIKTLPTVSINRLPKKMVKKGVKEKMKKWLIRKTIIEKCIECDNKVWVISEKCYCCEKRRLQNIKDPETIPKWCPLLDWKK